MADKNGARHRNVCHPIVFLFRVRELQVADTCAELIVPSTVAFHCYAGLRRPSLLAGISGLFFPLDECFADAWMDRHRLLRRFCFARSDETVDDGAGHVHRSSREVDIAPLESEQLALRRPCGG